MSTWTHLIRFKAKEDGQVHLGQLVDISRDVGLDCFNNIEVKAFLINGDMYSGTVTEDMLRRRLGAQVLCAQGAAPPVGRLGAQSPD
ncbi:hypothetical protein H9L39_19464 [Fusarium oxysporum f. sp. albedinis]|nr:hypothetical protein H9L39_19464 [Fusarium oxysporum f. sp. albedinis]